jgi:hypothetical protein
MKLISKRQCRCCKESFSPNYRSAKRQMYCDKPECRKASKAASQRRWTKNNPNYFKGSDNVERVREWRRVNPGRQRRKGSGPVLQDNCDEITDVKQEVIPLLPPGLPALPTVLHEAATLYLFLITVANCQGLSYYADASLCERLVMDAPTLACARACLLKSRLVAYKKPLYQVLALDAVLHTPKRISVPGEITAREDVGTLAIDKILASLAGGTP